MLFAKLYLLCLILFLSLDMLWVGYLAKDLYRDQVGHLFADQFNWGAALVFYLIYIAGVVFFCLLPAVKEANAYSAILYGAFFGFVCYAAYDLTNLATLKGWPYKIVIYDLLWGTFVTALTCYLAYQIASYKSLTRFFS